MILNRSCLVVLAIALATSVAAAAEVEVEVEWPRGSASDTAILATEMRFQIYADRCSAEVPQLKQKFDMLMGDLSRRIQGISTRLLASGKFKGMKDQQVPAEIVDALDDSFHDGKHNLERLDAAAICPKALQDFGGLDDESLTSSLAANLTAVQNMIQNLEKVTAR